MKVFIYWFLMSFSVLKAESLATLSANEFRVLEPLAAEHQMSTQDYFDSLPSCARQVFRHQVGVLDKLQVANGESLLDKVDRVLVIRGANPNGKCGGLNYHRVLWVFKIPLRNLIERNPNILLSKDRDGPHPGTDLSYETTITRPAMQFHTFQAQASSAQLELLSSRFEVDQDMLSSYNERLAEADLDYDWVHNSNPECFVRSFWGSVFHRILPVPRLFAEPAEKRFVRQWQNNKIASLKEVRP